MLTYTVELKPQIEGGYTVTVPVLPGCISEGDTLEKALENIKDAVEGYIQVLVKHGRKIPLEFTEFRQVGVFQERAKNNLESSLSYV
ncbi:MAG: type II toxin-antitoxin system HicB family antitoxin [Patescibacteria group bacterium]